MGAGHSLGKFPAEGSVVVEKGKGESGDVRRNPNYPELVPTYFPEVKTMYDAFQCVRSVVVLRYDCLLVMQLGALCCRCLERIVSDRRAARAGCRIDICSCSTSWSVESLTILRFIATK